MITLTTSLTMALSLILPAPTPSTAAPPPPGPGSPMPVIVLEDQFQKPHQLASERGDVIVLLYGDRQSAAANQLLGSQIHVHFHPTARGLPPRQASQAPVKPIPNWPADVRMPEVRVVPVASIGKVPSVVANIIRGQFRTKSPDVAVALDFEDRLKDTFGLHPGVSNLVVVDTQGVIRHVTSGTYHDKQVEQLNQFLEKLRCAAAPARK